MPDLHAQETPRSAKKGQAGSPAKVSEDKGKQKDWTIKGLPVEAVDIARDSARASGMKINAWVSQAFTEAATGGLPRRQEGDHALHSGSFDMDFELRKLRVQNDELLQTINNLSAAIAKMCK